MAQTLEQRVEALEAKIAEYEGSTEFLTSQIAGVHRKLFQFVRRVDARFDRLETRVESIEKKVDAIIPAIAKMFVEERKKK